MPGLQCPTPTDITNATTGLLVRAVGINIGGETPELCGKLLEGEKKLSEMIQAFRTCAPPHQKGIINEKIRRVDLASGPAIDACLSLAAAVQKPKGP